MNVSVMPSSQTANPVGLSNVPPNREARQTIGRYSGKREEPSQQLRSDYNSSQARSELTGAKAARKRNNPLWRLRWRKGGLGQLSVLAFHSSQTNSAGLKHETNSY